MILVNLIPRDQRHEQSLDRHPFFSGLLALSGPGGNPIIGKIADSHFAIQAAVLGRLARAFGAYSIAAPMAYRRVAELSISRESREMAQNLFDRELDRGPQFVKLMESLLSGLDTSLPEPEEFQLHRTLKINTASLAEAVAICEEIERAGNGVVSAWRDFVAQWQVFQGLPSSRVARAYLDESRQSSEALLNSHREVRTGADYAIAREKVNAELTRHFDEAAADIVSRLE
jgi:hypothetical protein